MLYQYKSSNQYKSCWTSIKVVVPVSKSLNQYQSPWTSIKVHEPVSKSLNQYNTNRKCLEGLGYITQGEYLTVLFYHLVSCELFMACRHGNRSIVSSTRCDVNRGGVSSAFSPVCVSSHFHWSLSAQGHFSRTAAALQESRSCRRQDDADADLLALVQNITQLVLKCPGPSFTTLHRAEISPNWCQMVLK